MTQGRRPDPQFSAPLSTTGSALTGLATESDTRTCVFTIASRNYMHSARTLMDGVARFAPAAHRILALCDERGDVDHSQDSFEILELSQLALPNKRHFIFQYSLLELNTAIKPFVVDQLFERGFDQVIYLDPDIAIYDRLDDMIGRLDHADILLTPHITEPLPDDGEPDERHLMVCGTFNLGFIAMRRSPLSHSFVRWWKQKLERDCVVDLQRGLFTDQKWVEFAPCFCERVEIVRHPGWNVAYWNLPTRHVVQTGDRFTVDGQPLVFFHFSGYDPDRGEFSRHQDRYTMSSIPTASRRRTMR
ncbi:MAG: glycosyl transferase [Planctomycetaceae bacterium]